MREVDRALRRRGVGAQLFSAHLDRLGAAGVRALFLEVDEGNAAARALYRRVGFEQVGERPSYYQGADGARNKALVLRKAL